MLAWLVAAAAVPLVASFAAHAQANRFQPPAMEKHAIAPNYLLPRIRQFRPQSPFEDGMIAKRDVAPNAHIGLGLVPMRGRKIHSVRIEQELVSTRNPGVTFVLKFSR